MDSPQQHPITDEDARRLAKEWARLMQAPIRVMGTRDFEETITTADMVRFGAMLFNGINKSTRDHLLKEKNRKHISTVINLIHEPDALETYFYNLIKERGEGAGDINEAIAQIEQINSGPGADRKFLQKAIAEALPKARQGRPSEFNPVSDPERFLALSSHLNRTCDLFLSLREQLPKKSNKELIDILEPEDPLGAEVMRKREGNISQILNDPDFCTLKTRKTRGRWLADAVAGKELFDWSFTYSVQRAGEFRRAKRIDPEE
jgi:hypothetical protein